MEIQGSDELLRQNVFSSIHMSTSIKSNQVSVSYPCCSLCGGSVMGSSGKKPPGRKLAVCQMTLYTNSSESFVVWGKKVDEPKGILWMRSCCVRRGSDTEGNMPIELLSKGCRGRCSYTLRFSSRLVAEDWYKLLKQESRKSTPLESDDPFSSDSGGEDDSPLDRILSDSKINDCGIDESISGLQPTVNRRASSPSMRLSRGDILSNSLTPKKPTSKGFRLPFGSSLAERKISLPSTAYHTNNDSILESPKTPAELERWSLPVKVSH